MEEVIFKKCNTCGNIVNFIVNAGPLIICCGKEMEMLKPGTIDASHEKHVPHVESNDNTMKVQIGSTIHPMTAEHYILFIYVQTDKGGQMKYLAIDDEPTAEFTFTDEKPIAVYEYCNLHGLWKTEEVK